MSVHECLKVINMKTRFEILEEKYPNTCIFQLRGNFYNAFEKSAHVLHVIKGYKVNKKRSGDKAGFPAVNIDKIAGELRKAHVNFVFFNNEEIVDRCEFEDNQFENLLNEYQPVADPDSETTNNDEQDEETVRKEYDGHPPERYFRVIPSCQSFAAELFTASAKAEKEYRFTLCKKVTKFACKLIHSARMANKYELGSEDRKKQHEKSLELIEKINDLLPVMRRCRCLTVKQEATLTKRLGSLKYGYEKWIESDENRTEP